MKISPLHDIPHAVIPVAEYNFNEWGHKRPGDSVEKTIKRIQESVDNRTPPMTIVAYDDKKYVGSVTLTVWEMGIYPEKEYWLGDLFVVPEKRRRGIGRILVYEVEALAKSLGIPALNLYTFDMESLYKGLGWETDEYIEYENEAVTVMSKQL